MNESSHNIGDKIFNLAKKLFPICRSLTGDGVRETLSILQSEVSDLVIGEIPTGTICGDWTVPNEWNIRDAYILDPNGKKIIDFNESNLHILSYSEPISATMSLEELLPHLHSDPILPDAIPYRTSYYEKRWGFCLSHNQLCSLEDGVYTVYIDSTLKPGFLTYGELIIPGKTSKEVFVSTYICHPSLGNNELSGIVVTCFIIKWLQSCADLNYTYRFFFGPETIGPICYLDQNIADMTEHIIAGFNITCIGDDNGYSYLKSRAGNTLSDRVAKHVLRNISENFTEYPFITCGSDERQYCSPGVDLPLVSLMRSKYGEYPEYHTSLDNLDVITSSGLGGGYDYVKLCLECIEQNKKIQLLTRGQPQLGKYGLYPTLSTSKLSKSNRQIVNLLLYADGSDLLDIAETLNVPMWELFDVVMQLQHYKLIVVK